MMGPSINGSWGCVLALVVSLASQPCGGSDSGDTSEASYLVDIELLTCGMNMVFERPDIPCRAAGGCEALYEPMLEAMQMYEIDLTIARAASFVATVFHETDIFRTFHQPLDDGAGALHILPANLRVACCQIAAYESEIWGLVSVRNCDLANMCGSYLCDALVDQPGCLENSEMSSLVYDDPYMSFLTGAWFFRHGAKSVYGDHQTACEDLSEYSDQGVGEVDLVTASQLISPWQCAASTGFHRVSCCVYGGFANTLGLTQRLKYFEAIAADLSQCDAARSARPTRVEESSSGKSVLSQNLPYLLLGVACCGATILFARKQGPTVLGTIRDARVPRLSTGGVLEKDYKTYAELELWVEQNFPDLNLEIPAGAHCWAFEDLVIYLKTGRLPGTTGVNNSFVYSDESRFSSINPLKPNGVDDTKGPNSPIAAGGLAYGPLTAVSLTMSGALPGAWPGLGGSHVMPQYPPRHEPYGYPAADDMMQRDAQGQPPFLELAPRPQCPPPGSPHGEPGAHLS